MIALLMRFTKSEKTNLPDESYSTSIHHVILRIPADEELENTVRQGWHLNNVEILGGVI